MNKRALLIMLPAVLFLILPVLASGCSGDNGQAVAAGAGSTAAVAAEVTAATAASTTASAAPITSATSAAPSTSVTAGTPAEVATTTATTSTTDQENTTTTKKPVGPLTTKNTASTLAEPPTTSSSLYRVSPTVTLKLDPWHGYEETDSRLKWQGDWIQWYSDKASNSSYKSVASGPASLFIKFEGQRIAYHAMRESRAGIAKLTLDGATTYMVDTYSSMTFHSNAVWMSPSLPEGTHTLLIEFTGQKNPAATHPYLMVDAIWIYGKLLD